MAFRYFKFSIFLLITLAFYVIAFKFGSVLWEELVKYLIFPITFFMLNYAFFKLIVYIIAYYNSIIIFYDYKIFVVKSTLITVDYVEVIDMDKVTKFDTYINWIIGNLLWFWTLVVEQQRDKVRELRFVPDSHKAVRILTRTKKNLLEEEWQDV